MTLEYVSSKLDDWHPATGGYVHCAYNLHMVLRDTLGPYCPPGFSPAAIYHAFLRRNFINYGDYGSREKLTSKNLSTEVATCFINLLRVIGLRP